MIKSKAIRALEQNAKKGKITSAFELYLCYQQGQGVDKDEVMAQSYLNQCQLFVENPSNHLLLSDLVLRDFRRFSLLELKLDPKLTVLIGDNGAGKSSIADALSKALSWLSANLEKEGKAGRPITDADIKIQAPSHAEIYCQLNIGKHNRCDIELFRAVKGISISKNSKLENIRLWADILRTCNARQEINLPVLAYYSVNRTQKKTNTTTLLNTLDSSKQHRFDAYDKALDGEGRVDFEAFVIWFSLLSNRQGQHQEAQKLLNDITALENILQQAEGDKTALLQIITLKQAEYQQRAQHLSTQARAAHEFATLKAVVKKLVHGFEDIFIAIHPESGKRELRINYAENGVVTNLHIDQISEGQYAMLGLAADLTRRLILLNPKLDSPLEGQGIVIIDEIELHLHPRWQQTVLADLQNTFPNIQFIVTTHSPQVITTVSSEHIRILNDSSLCSAPHGSKGAESSRILKRFFQVDPRPPEDAITRLLKRYEQLVYADQWETDEAQQLRRQLDQSFAGEEPKLTELDLYIENRKWELEIEEGK